jgi:hypothetical protein
MKRMEDTDIRCEYLSCLHGSDLRSFALIRGYPRFQEAEA